MSDPWFSDLGNDGWVVALPDPARAAQIINRISARIADRNAAPLWIELDGGDAYAHDELVGVAASSLEVMGDALASDRVEEEDLDDLAAAVNNLRIVALAIAVTDGGDAGDDGGVMGIVSYLSRLLGEAVGALDRSVTELPDGRFRLRWRGADREIVERLAAELDETLEADHPDLTRLFPPAYGTDDVRSREFDALARHELIDSRRAALATLRQAMAPGDLTADELSALMRAVNDLRLVVGTRLDVTEDVRPRISPSDPTFPDWLAYERLTHLLAQLVQALG